MQIKKTNFKNISENELDEIVWRYITFPKFISLLTYGSLWFSKLYILQDQYEGMLPTATKSLMHKNYQKWKETFTSPDSHKQIDEMPDRNVSDGRELTVVNCWFLGNSESQKMWNDYVKNSEGVAIKSTIRKLAIYVYVEPEYSHIGKVKYVNFDSYKMSLYDAHQAPERAFLKSKDFEHEQEIRIATMSIKTAACVNMNGIPYSSEEIAGKNMNNFENPGLYIRVNIEKLFDTIVLAPQAPEWFELLVKRIIELSKLNINIMRSELE